MVWHMVSYFGDKSPNTQMLNRMWTCRAAGLGIPHSRVGEPSVRQVRSPMHGWLHREQRCGVKTKDYRKTSIILSNPRPQSATFLFSFAPHHQQTAFSFLYMWAGRKTDKAQKKTSWHGRIRELLCSLELECLVAAPETCFNSCVCVFGGTLPQGNIFPFYCFK